jgi:hypothetical protein
VKVDRQVGLLSAGLFVLALAAACGTSSWPRPVSATVLPYRPEARGKFLVVCLDRALEKRESYPASFKMTLNDGRVFELDDHFSDREENADRCFDFNVYHGVRRSSRAKDLAIVDAIAPGNVATLIVTMRDDFRRNSTTHTFKGL